MKALRFRLYPNPVQEDRLIATIEACRCLWNDALAHRKRSWEVDKDSVSYNCQQWILTAVRASDHELQRVYSQSAQDVLRRLDRAFKEFFAHHAGYPKYKRRGQFGSFTYPQAYHGSVKPDVVRKRLFLSKIGNVRAVFHRPLPRDARLKTCTVIRDSCGEWYASLVYEDIVPLQNIGIAKVPLVISAPIGIDLGLKALITTSDGRKVEHPRFLRKAENRLRRKQKDLSRKQKGSKNRFKARQRVASVHAKVKRQRGDFNHKLSAELVRDHGLVAFEELRIRNMVRNPALAKSILDAGWGQLVRFAEYKATNGRLVVRVEAAYSTQECIFCGNRNNVSLEVRDFACSNCGKVIDRDVNAARIVLKRAIAKVGQGMPELKPVEAGPLSPQSTEAASLPIEAGTRVPVRQDGEGVT